jgi:hypothetical protein
MAKLDGTNGLIQQYDYQVLTTGFSYTFASGTQTLVINPAATLASGTITMTAAPADGMVLTIESTQQVTAITIQGNTGQSLVGGASQLIPNKPLSYIYRLSNTTWYPYQSGGGNASSIVTGTAQNSTSGTSIDFTGIPSWVKRITVMFNQVSTNGSSNKLIQLGAGSVTTTGYVAESTSFSGAAVGGASSYTTGFGIASGGAGEALFGNITICQLGSNLWVANYVLGNVTGANNAWIGSGYVTLSGALDRVRITTVNGTDTFDAGSINILYE